MPIAIFLVAIAAALSTLLIGLVAGFGIAASLALTPFAGSIAAVLFVAYASTRPSAPARTPVRGANSEPDLIPAP
jgi:uncharacterized protein YaaW (UPF0174 family)